MKQPQAKCSGTIGGVDFGTTLEHNRKTYSDDFSYGVQFHDSF